MLYVWMWIWCHRYRLWMWSQKAGFHISHQHRTCHFYAESMHCRPLKIGHIKPYTCAGCLVKNSLHTLDIHPTSLTGESIHPYIHIWWLPHLTQSGAASLCFAPLLIVSASLRRIWHLRWLRPAFNFLIIMQIWQITSPPLIGLIDPQIFCVSPSAF